MVRDASWCVKIQVSNRSHNSKTSNCKSIRPTLHSLSQEERFARCQRSNRTVLWHSAELVAGPGVAQQAYNFSEPFLAEEKGVAVRNLMLSEVGYNPYASCLVCTEKQLQEQGSIVEKMVQASVEGWQKYMESPAETNAYILKQNNQGMTAEALKYGSEKLKDLCLPNGLDSAKMGQMDEGRWQELRDILVDLNLIKGDKVDAKKCFELKYLKR